MGMILFIMVTGIPPFSVAIADEDAYFRAIGKGTGAKSFWRVIQKHLKK